MAKAKEKARQSTDKIGLHLITIGRRNYNGSACGFTFKDSICAVNLRPGRDQLALRRLLALIQGSKIEPITVGKKAEEEAPAEDPQKSTESASDESGSENTETSADGQEATILSEETHADDAAKDESEAPAEEGAEVAAETPESETETKEVPAPSTQANSDESGEDDEPVDLDAMDRDSLKEFIKTEDLGIRVKDLTDDAIRVAIVAALEE